MTNIRPEFILSSIGDMVFDGDDGYEDLLESLLEESDEGLDPYIDGVVPTPVTADEKNFLCGDAS